MLKVRQSSNAQFGFINPGHDLYPFYAYLKRHGGTIPVPQKAAAVADKDNGSESSAAEADDAGKEVAGLGGLLGMYSSSSDDDSDDNSTSKSGTATGVKKGEDSNAVKTDKEDEAGGLLPKKCDTGNNAEGKRGDANDDDVVVPPDTASSSSSITASAASTDEIDLRKAKRLQRAKMMKDRLALKMKRDASAAKGQT